jgi:hypothetical protein
VRADARGAHARLRSRARGRNFFALDVRRHQLVINADFERSAHLATFDAAGVKSMTRAARSSGQRQPQQPGNPTKSDRESGPSEARQSLNFYEPLPLGSDAFMAPLAPAREERAFDLRQIALWCVLGTATGAAAGALVLSFVLDRDPEPKDALGKVEVAAVANDDARGETEPESKPARAVAAMPSADGAQPTADPAQQATAASAAGTQPAATQPTADAAEGSATPPPANSDARADGAERSTRSRRAARSAEPSIEKPSRAQVIAAMTRVQPAVRACLPGGHGMVTADISILGRTGHVTTAQISGQIGKVGSCVARAVRKARFPTFKAESITVRYPMAL